MQLHLPASAAPELLHVQHYRHMDLCFGRRTALQAVVRRRPTVGTLTIALELGGDPATSRNRLTLKVFHTIGSVSATKFLLKAECGHNCPLKLLEDQEMLSLLQSRPMALSLGVHYSLFRPELHREVQLAQFSTIVRKLQNVVRLKIGENLGQIGDNEVLELLALPSDDDGWPFPAMEILEVRHATFPQALADLIRNRQHHCNDRVSRLWRVGITRSTVLSCVQLDRVPEEAMAAVRKHTGNFISDP